MCLYAAGCHSTPTPAEAEPIGRSGAPRVADVVISSPGASRPPFRFQPADEQLLDEVQQGAFWFLWHEAPPETGLVVDRTSVKFSSIAGVGFKLAAIPIGVERGWITREQAETRVRAILTAFESAQSKGGLYFHFLDARTGQLPPDAYEDVVSTIDSAILFAGLLTASSYFGGDIGTRADALFAAADWAFFVVDEPQKAHWKGFISLGWKPKDRAEPTGDGDLLPYVWLDAGDEQRLVSFLGAAAPKPEHRVDAAMYYRLRRQIGTDEQAGEIAYIPWSGALFTHFFAHCFIDYASAGPDNPAKAGIERRARIDWWENSRRAVVMQRRKAIVNPTKSPTFGPNSWGLTACDFVDKYGVPGLYPTPKRFADERPDEDFETERVVADEWGDGTLAPYGAGCSVMFEPELAVAALRHYRGLQDAEGQPLVWREFFAERRSKPGTREGYGFQDSFNVGTGYVSVDCVAIDQGPLVLAIENARTGSVWKWFSGHKFVQDGYERLGIQPRRLRAKSR